MRKILVVDTSTLVALERAKLTNLLNKIPYKIIIPRAVEDEIKNKSIIKIAKRVDLRGRTLKQSKNLERLNIGKGEAQCCALASKLKLKFIICDDAKFMRQKFFSRDKTLGDIKISGFSFFLHIFQKYKLIINIWGHFYKLIKLNNWQRSEVYVANYIFLKEMGY